MSADLGVAPGGEGRAKDLGPAAAEEPGRRRNAGFLAHAAWTAVGGLASFAIVLVLGFFMFRMLPGDPVTTMTRGRPTNAAQLDELRRSLGLDQPLWRQFVDYVAGAVTGDLGTSFEYQQPVIDVITGRLGPTLLLTGVGMLLAVALGLPLGARAGWRQGSLFDRMSVSVALTLWSVPTFWLGLILLMVLGVGVGPVPGLFPVGGMSSDDVGPGVLAVALDVGHHMVLPTITIVAVIYAQYLLVMRSSMIDEIGNEYLTTARAKGLRDEQVRSRHATPNALLPTVTLIMMNIGFLVTGAITTEYVYSWPGLGSLTADALAIPDLPLLQGTFIVFSGSVIVMNVVADVLYRVLDPRLRTA